MTYVEVHLLQISSSHAQTDSCVLALGREGMDSAVPIVIGLMEAHSIVISCQSDPLKRPSTHLLLQNVLDELGIELTHVSIDRFEEGVFYASLHLSDGFNKKVVDSRTSDAVTLAILHKAPIMMSLDVWNDTSAPCEAFGIKKGIEEENDLEELQRQLRQCEEEEDYERAEQLLKKINALKHDNPTND